MITYSHKADARDTMDAWADKKPMPASIKELVEQHPDIGKDVVAHNVVMDSLIENEIIATDAEIKELDESIKINKAKDGEIEELKKLKTYRATLVPVLISCTLSARFNTKNWVGDYSVWNYTA